MRRIGLSLPLFAAISCAAPPKPLSWHCPENGPVLETVTYNAGLAPGVVALATPRRRPVAEAVGTLGGVGLICLQEIWTEEAETEVLAALGLPETHVFRADTRGEVEMPGTFACTADAVDPVLSCVEKRCRGWPTEDQSICALERCRAPLVRVFLKEKACMNCLISTAGHSSSEVRELCVSDRGHGRIYGGSNGVILASRWPLEDREVVRLPSSGANRVALLATVRVPGHEPIEVGCTHLSSETYMDPILPEFEDWQDEMRAQFDLASRRIGERAGGRPQILLGDMNAGPAREGYGALTWPDTGSRGKRIDASASRVWAAIQRAGWDSAATRLKPTGCTTCTRNTLRSSRSNHLIDHVLVRDPPGGTTVEPVCAHPHFEETVTVVDELGQAHTTSLSDHYGMVVKYRLK